MIRTGRVALCATTAVFLTLSIAAQARNNPEYDDCLLQHLKNARLDAATQLITRACHENYVDGNFQSKREIRRNNCLLENLPGIESFDAVARVTEVCERKSKEK